VAFQNVVKLVESLNILADQVKSRSMNMHAVCFVNVHISQYMNIHYSPAIQTSASRNRSDASRQTVAPIPVTGSLSAPLARMSRAATVSTTSISILRNNYVMEKT